jgi:membrane-bound ClpP family serine protease
MNVKRTFGTILTILGIIGLIYAKHDAATRQLIVFGIIGIIFFFSGIGLVKNTKDES